MLSLEQVQKTLEDNWGLLKASQDRNMLPAMRLLYEHIANPQTYVTMVGETSSGKSTLINAFLGRKVLPAGAKPTTGTVTWLEYGVGAEDKYYAIDRNAQVTGINKDEFDRLSISPPENLLRLRAQLRGDKKDFHGLTIFDTPGYNSIIVEHEEILKEFLPESDVVIFPVSYRTGFGQMDQELMTLVSELPAENGEVPVILVVNRAPSNIDIENDVRIKEIKSHAEDTLHRSLNALLVVYSSLPDENKQSRLPDVRELWKKVGEIAFAPERKERFVKRCNEILGIYYSQRVNELKGVILAAKNPESVKRIMELQASLKVNKEASLKIIDKYTTRILHQFSKIMDKEVKSMLEDIDQEIDNASKWIDITDCSNFIANHKIPFGIRKVIKTVSEYITSEIELMDAELSEMANKAFRELSDQAQMEKQPELAELLKNLSFRIGQQLIGKTAGTMLKSLGGVGGMAAGAGNLVKMIVKQVGKLFKHTFSKEVYRTIGKIFTKKMMATIFVGLDAIVEIAGYISESNKWQGELKKNAHKVVEQWLEEAKKEMIEKSIPDLQQNNRESVMKLYDDMNNEYQCTIDAQKSKINPDSIAAMQRDVATLEAIIPTLS